MKIAFAGPQSSGKTTLLDILRTKEEFKDYTFYDNITRKIQAEGYDINQNSCAATQFRIAQAHKEICDAENFIADRSMIDCYVYSVYLYEEGKLDKEDAIKLLRDLTDIVDKYDYIFYLRPEFKPVADGTRDLDDKYYNRVVELFEEVITDIMDKVDVMKSKIIPLTGTPEERIAQLMEVVKC